MSPPSPERHLCHCGKGFLRKEHLRRHQATHGNPSFICQVCQRSFTRSDLLRRHLALHDVVVTSDPKRIRACDACHTSKIRCDGGDRCSLCTKRGIDCLFTRAGPRTTPNPRQGTTPSGSPGSPPSIIELPPVGGPHQQTTPPMPSQYINGGSANQQHDTGSVSIQGLKTIQKTISQSHSGTFKCQGTVSAELKQWSSACIKTYLGHFHDRWPLIHAPAFELDTFCVDVRASVLMIGAWFQNDATTKSLILEIHALLVKCILNDLMESTIDSESLWPADTCQAALLNVIFAFEIGREKDIAKGRRLYTVLVTVLRQNNTFNSEALERQINTHFAGGFEPWLFTIRERWRRLAVCAFKIDTYISLLANQPPLLQREELDLGLPSTHALWNAYGLDVFDRRYPSEPLERAHYRISNLALGSQQPIPSGVLIEDIQVRMMGATNYIWIITQMRRKNSPAISSDQTGPIAARLKRCKLQLDGLVDVFEEPGLHKQHYEYLLRAYLGEETPSQVGWEDLVKYRFSSFVFSVTMLYHLLCLHMYADVHTFIQGPPCLSPIDLQAAGMAPLDQIKQMKAQEWAHSMDARVAVMHAIFAYRAYGGSIAAQSDLQTQVIDPVTYMALSAGAAVMWTWVMNSEATCTCMAMVLAPELDLGFVPLGAGRSPEVEHWILNGGTISLHGVHICQCNMDIWLSPFAVILSHGARTWEMSDVFAQKLWTKLGGHQ